MKVTRRTRATKKVAGLLLILLASLVESASSSSSIRSILQQHAPPQRRHARLLLLSSGVRGGDSTTITASTTTTTAKTGVVEEETSGDDSTSTTVSVASNQTLPTVTTTTRTTIDTRVDDDDDKPVTTVVEESTNKLRDTKRLHMSVCAVVACTTIAVTIPIVILPLMASSDSFSATVASISSLGGGIGQLLNGFVCQSIGGRRTSFMYMLGTAMCCLLLASSSSSSGNVSATYVGLVLAGLEFCSSVQWTACSVVLAKQFAATDPGSYAQGITYMGLTTTFGTLGGKMIAPALLQYGMTWQQLSRLGALAAVTGALVMATMVREPTSSGSLFSFGMVKESIGAIMGSGIFWIAAIPYTVAFVPRTSEKVLGNFFQGITKLPASLCGGLTASITVGFIHGLVSSSSFHSLPSIQLKTNMLKRRYFGGGVASLLLAISANHGVISMLHNPHLLAFILVCASGFMASCLAFQFYQLPNIIANAFFTHNAVALSLLDGVAFLTVAPIWAILGRLVRQFQTHGWSLAWAFVAALYAVGGIMCVKVMPTILERQPTAATS